jgi:dipeptidyl aminopeptidase/acylaminoacyl peptidase
VRELSAEQAAAARVDVDAVSIRTGYAYWLEKRSATGGTALLRMPLAGGGERPQAVTPEALDVGSRVHEYGGGAYWVAEDEKLFVVNDSDQRIYRLADDGPLPLTPSSGSPATVRYADLRTLPGGRLVCVRERHEPGGEVVNELVTLTTNASGPAAVVAGGRDFYSFPRPDPSGTQLAFTCWDHPQMPWDGTELWLADLTPDGSLTGAHRVAGGSHESLFQPEWSPDGQLHVMSDRTGWWNLYRVGGGELEPVYLVEAECGEPQWEFGYSTYAFLDARQIVVLARERGEDKLLLVDAQTGRAEQLPSKATSIKPYLAADHGHIAYIAGTPSQLPAVLIRSTGSLNERPASQARSLLPTSVVTMPERHWVPSERRAPVPIWLHPPAVPPDSPPPLLVRPHPGPTSQTRLRLEPDIEFFTTRGFAVADVDYRGSTGYGRLYRQALSHLWGIADAEDCVTVARWLADTRRADPARTVISGASAGGFTALCALALSDIFVAGSCVSGIVDLLQFRQQTHKFQRQELDRLIGPLPDSLPSYESRSPVNLVDQIDRPVFLAHGLNDPVVPAAAVQALAQALRTSGTPHVARFFEHEGHPPSRPENHAALLQAELAFYQAVFAGESALAALRFI